MGKILARPEDDTEKPIEIANSDNVRLFVANESIKSKSIPESEMQPKLEVQKNDESVSPLAGEKGSKKKAKHKAESKEESKLDSPVTTERPMVNNSTASDKGGSASKQKTST